MAHQFFPRAGSLGVSLATGANPPQGRDGTRQVGAGIPQNQGQGTSQKAISHDISPE